MALSVVSSGVDSIRFRKHSVNVVADRFRGWPPRGVHAQLAPPRRAPVLPDESQASASPLSTCLASSLAAIVFLRESGDRDAVAAAEPKTHSTERH